MLKLIPAALSCVALSLGVAVPSHADPGPGTGDLTSSELALAEGISGDLCLFIDQHGVSTPTMTALVQTIYRSPLVPTYEDSVEIINYDVYNYCPRFWPQLVSFGEGARSQR